MAIASSESGAVAFLDRDGARLVRESPLELDPPARALAFAGDDIALLQDDSVRRPDHDTPIPVPPGARAIAFTMGGGLLVGLAERLFRFGDHPLEFALSAGFGLRAIAVDPGGYWLGGAACVAGFRPAAEGLVQRRSYDVEAPVRALAYGPDGAVYALLESGALLRDGEQRAVLDAIGIARAGKRLLALRNRLVEDITRYVAPPPEKGPEFVLPPCDS